MGVGEDRSLVDPAEIGGRETGGLGVDEFSLFVELVGVKDHAEAAPGRGGLGLAAGGGELGLDRGADAGFDGGEVGGWEFGGLGGRWRGGESLTTVLNNRMRVEKTRAPRA